MPEVDEGIATSPRRTEESKERKTPRPVLVAPEREPRVKGNLEEGPPGNYQDSASVNPPVGLSIKGTGCPRFSGDISPCPVLGEADHGVVRASPLSAITDSLNSTLKALANNIRITDRDDVRLGLLNSRHHRVTLGPRLTSLGNPQRVGVALAAELPDKLTMRTVSSKGNYDFNRTGQGS